ncbi:MAG: methyltransferase domain-containing protein [Lachnospiraceae bacterium]|jgi:ubiquinone/menaquinone biosynthesis C-methylase UbiE|nr:methyltransferase domain-containing protein [Lachnospiraceae bacterium]
MGELELIPFEKEDPGIKDRVQFYWNQRAASFYEQRRAEIESDKAAIWADEIIKHLPKGKDSKILDIGCGAGFFPVLLGRMGYTVTGIDLTEEMVNHANKLIELYELDTDKVKALRMDAEKPDFPDESFDAIITRNLTWTLPHPMDAYKEWAKVLKRGGILINFDAEYAKEEHAHHSLDNPAHAGISQDLKDECHKLYHMLTISALTRPEWDAEVLVNYGFKDVNIDKDFYKKVFAKKDDFYIENLMFRIKAVKA